MKDRKVKTALKVVHRNDRAQIKRVLGASGQALLPMLELLEGAKASIDELMHDSAVALVEQLLVLAAQELAGAKQRGRADGAVLWHGAQRGVVSLAERQLHVQRPRLRDKRGHEVHVPAYERLRDDAGMGQRVRDILVAGVSTRRYAAVLPQAAGTVGVSKSAVSRRFVEASAEPLAALNERDLKDLKLLVIYIDGIVVHGHHILAAVGVDEAGDKHLLGLAPGASENAQVVKDLLQGLIDRGLDASLSYLFVIDGGKALRSAIDQMFGQRAHVQRCRTHKLRNVLDRLPKTEAAQTKAVMMAPASGPRVDGPPVLGSRATVNSSSQSVDRCRAGGSPIGGIDCSAVPGSGSACCWSLRASLRPRPRRPSAANRAPMGNGSSPSTSCRRNRSRVMRRWRQGRPPMHRLAITRCLPTGRRGSAPSSARARARARTPTPWCSRSAEWPRPQARSTPSGRQAGRFTSHRSPAASC